MEFVHGVCLLQGHVIDRLRDIPDNYVHCVVTSPPYWKLRDYGIDGQLGLEASPGEYIENMMKVFREVNRVLRPDGVLWVNMGDGYAQGPTGQTHNRDSDGSGGRTPWNHDKPFSTVGHGLKPKDLIGMPWRLALAMQESGWWLRSENIWHKTNPMPETVYDRPSRTHEHMFQLTKSAKYFYDAEAVKVPVNTVGRRGVGKNSRLNVDRDVAHNGRQKTKRQKESLSAAVSCEATHRNLRTVWEIPVESYKGAHFACFPRALVTPCILSSTSEFGACSNCGSPWIREVESERVPTRPGRRTKATGDSMTDGNRDPQRHVTSTRTVGWKQQCNCEATEPEPCVVLDPFNGSGTTGEVARQLGCRYIGIELNPQYLDLTRQRLIQPSLFVQ